MQEVGAERDERIYRSVAPELLGFAVGLVGEAHAADVVSGAVVGAISSRSWAQVENPRAYLYRAVANEAKTWQRRASRRRTIETHSAPASTVELPAIRPEVRAAVDRLSVRQRAVILLTYWADLSPADTAEYLGISEGSVRRHLARARATLREVLDD